VRKRVLLALGIVGLPACNFYRTILFTRPWHLLPNANSWSEQGDVRASAQGRQHAAAASRRRQGVIQARHDRGLGREFLRPIDDANDEPYGADMDSKRITVLKAGGTASIPVEIIPDETVDQLIQAVAPRLGFPEDGIFLLFSATASPITGNVYDAVSAGEKVTLFHLEKGGGGRITKLACRL
jgi:hypothetical protein